MCKVQPISMTSFALRHWQVGRCNTTIEGLTPESLVAQCNAALASGSKLIAGYAPFCKHIFLENTSPTRCAFAPVTEDNQHLLRCGYQSRREGELAVLERWFEGLKAPIANYLDVILYSHSQLIKETAFDSKQDVPPNCDWGIVSIIGTLENCEPPMPPITQMRNALGISQGGSGVPIDPQKYTTSVEFWQHYAAVK